MTARERERRLAVLEAASALRAKAEADAAVNAAFDALLASLTREQLREAIRLARALRAGTMTQAEAGERIVAVPGMDRHFPRTGTPPDAT